MCLLFSPLTGSYVPSAAHDGKILCWDLEGQQRRTKLVTVTVCVCVCVCTRIIVCVYCSMGVVNERQPSECEWQQEADTLQLRFIFFNVANALQLSVAFFLELPSLTWCVLLLCVSVYI